MKNSSKNVIRSFLSSIRKECDKHWEKHNEQACKECPFFTYSASPYEFLGCKFKVPSYLDIEEVLRIYEKTMRENSKGVN